MFPSNPILLKPKPAFTLSEINLLGNKNLFLAKARITQKLQTALLLVEKLYARELIKYDKKLPAEIVNSKGKITKGENLSASPWMVLDYPKEFSRQNIFAIRTLIWWGKHVSVSLVLSGSYKKLYEQNIFKAINTKPTNLFVCIGQTPWEHDILPGNFLKAGKLTSKEITEIKNRSFLKLSFKISIKEINSLEVLVLEKFKGLLQLF